AEVIVENKKIGEIEKGFFEISVRSFDEVNALNVVKEFNGGGHIHACGMSAIGDFEEIRAKVVELCKKEIKRCRKLKAE
ncbi:MAG: DHHA1 domain-containing protein, partial [Clostridia bacterium]